MRKYVFVIGEMGSTHDGDLSKALQLVKVAKAAGCDAVKAQYWSSPERLAERRRAPEYLEVYRRYQLLPGWLEFLKRRCDEAGIEFMATTYIPEDVATVAPLVRRFKIASFEATDLDFVRVHLPYGKPIYVSAGMLEQAQVYRLSGWLRAPDDVVLHCISAYPCPPQDLNLRAIGSSMFPADLDVGLSDHTQSLLSGAVAVGAGAVVIEKHFRLQDTDRNNPDCAVALGPSGLRQYIAHIREADVLMGDGIKRPMLAEEPMRKYQVR
jgi:N,N'-diacetyllegionaminate synthase